MHEDVKLNKNNEEKLLSIKQNRTTDQNVALPPSYEGNRETQRVNYISSPLLTKETGKRKIKLSFTTQIKSP